MDELNRIYEAPEDEIPTEDKARLAGYLKGRADADMKARMEELEAKVAEAARSAAREADVDG